jgi:hypothetical protein
VKMTRRGKRKVIIAARPTPTSRAKTRPKEKQELTRLGAALRTLGGLGGSAVGGWLGNPAAGAATGTGLGAALSRWLGSGDYTVTKNSLVSSLKASGTIPMMHESGQSIIVRHKEFLGEVTSSTGFAVQASYPINPGLAQTFPWLNRLATCYQQYEIKGMIFHYVPTSGNAVSSSNNALGSVMLQTSYRVTDSAPTSKVELLNEYWSTEVVPSETTCHPIECNPKENPFTVHYVRSGTLPDDENALMYDIGVTHVCTSGQQTAGVVLGDLWVTYEIELKKPIVASDVTSSIGRNVFITSSSLFAPSTSSYFPSAITRTEGLLDVEVQNRSLFFAKAITGQFDIILTIRGNEALSAPETVLAPTVDGCTVINYMTTLNGNVDRVEFNSSGGSLRQWTYICSIHKQTKETAATVTLPASNPTATLLERTILSVYRKSEV